jgi:hypothetical protein
MSILSPLWVEVGTLGWRITRGLRRIPALRWWGIPALRGKIPALRCTRLCEKKKKKQQQKRFETGVSIKVT